MTRSSATTSTGRHPAALNLADCYAYAVASNAGDAWVTRGRGEAAQARGVARVVEAMPSRVSRLSRGGTKR